MPAHDIAHHRSIPHSIAFSGNALSPSRLAWDVNALPPWSLLSCGEPEDLGGTHGHSGATDASKPHHHRRLPERSDVLPAAWRWEGVPRMCPCLRHVPWLSAHT